MYQGSNPSALRSREWLRRAMLELLAEKSYAEITVKDLCARADLSRPTFYKIYDSKEDVIAYHFAALFALFAAELPEGHSAEDLHRHFFTFFYRHREFVELLLHNNLAYLLEEQFEQYLGRLDLFRRTIGRSEHADYLAAYAAGALARLLLRWAADGYRMPPEEIAHLAWQAGAGYYTQP